MIKKTHDKFVEEVRNLVGNDFEVLGEYLGGHTKVLMKHNKCGYEWGVTPNNFLVSGSRCPKCNGKIKWTQEEFVGKVYGLVGDEYTVLGSYKNAKTKVVIRHNKCGYDWNIVPGIILNGHKCPKCPRISHNKKTHEVFVREVHDLTGDEYTVLGDYKHSMSKIKMIHNGCGNEWEIIPSAFLVGRRCPQCATKRLGKEKRKTHDEFIEQFKKTKKSDYTVIGKYKTSYEKIKIKHDACGFSWYANTQDLLSGSGCPNCRKSRGEKAVEDFLIEANIKYVAQYRIAECRNKYPLPFDFAVMKNGNIECLIEYQGVQHFKPIKAWGGDAMLRDLKKRDSIKRAYCEDNKIPLIEIPYTEKNIENFLETALSQKIGKQLSLSILT